MQESVPEVWLPVVPILQKLVAADLAVLRVQAPRPAQPAPLEPTQHLQVHPSRPIPPDPLLLETRGDGTRMRDDVTEAP